MADVEPPASGPGDRTWVRHVATAIVLQPLVWLAAVTGGAGPLVAAGVLGDWIAGRGGVVVGVLIAAAVVMVIAVLVVLGSHPESVVLPDMAIEAGVIAAAGAVLTLGWFVGEVVLGRPGVGLVGAVAVLVVVAAVVVVRRPPEGVVAMIRARAASNR